MLEFLQLYGSYLLSAIIILFDLVLFPILKTKFNEKAKDYNLLKILEKLPIYITEAEDLFTNGKSKLAYVLQKVNLECLVNKTEYNEEVIKTYIENILKTPKKKENK